MSELEYGLYNMKVWAHKANLTPPLFIEVHVSYVCKQE
jgi:hypothetical protein